MKRKYQMSTKLTRQAITTKKKKKKKKKKSYTSPFTATGRIYTSPKRPSRWPRTYIYVPPQFSFLRICRSPATDVVVVACLRGVFFVSSLIAACSSGPFSLRKQFFYASRGFFQMAGNSVVDVPRCDKLVRAVRLMAFVTTAIEERAGFVLLKARATNDGGYLLGEETSDGGAWGENDHTSAVNEDLDVSTHSERSPCHCLRRGIVGTNVRASLRVKHCESAVRRSPKQERCVNFTTTAKLFFNHDIR